jgi:hypothetical protein
MANELQYYGEPATDSGLTVVARLYDTVGAQVGSDISTSETGVLAIYRGDMPSSTPAGVYGVRFFDSNDNLLGQGVIEWDGNAEVTALDLKNSTLDANIVSVTDTAVVDVADFHATDAGGGDSTFVFR